MKEQKNRNMTQKIGVRLIAAMILIALAIVGTFAAYINQSYKKGVVTTRKSNTLFSSNYLNLWNTNAGIETQYVVLTPDDTAGTVELVVNIRNYYGENTSRVNAKDIVYDLDMVLSGNTSDVTQYQVTYQNQTNQAENLGAEGLTWEKKDCTLQGRRVSQDQIRITVPKADFDAGNVAFEIKVIPQDFSVTDGYALAGVVRPIPEGRMIGFSYEGEFTDAASGEEPEAFDAFNYEVTISTGIADVTVSWDSNELEIDPFAAENLNGTISETGSQLIFRMDASLKSSELLTFYRKSAPTEGESWAELKGKVTVTAVQQSTNAQ